MLTIIPDELARYVEEHSAPEPELLVRLRDETRRDLTAPQMQVGRVEGAFLRLMVQLSRARSVLEVGTYSGYSALSMASGLPDDGRVITCDVDPVATKVAQRYFAESPHGHKIELRLGDARETLANLARTGERFDLAFIDADKEGYVHYWDTIVPLIEPGGVILADNALWSGRVLNPTSQSDRGVAEFNDHVAKDARVDHVLLSIRDGIMLATKRR